jgi:hypothetical protein
MIVSQQISDLVEYELAEIVDNSFNIHEVGTHDKRFCFRLPDNPESKLKAWARNDHAFEPNRPRLQVYWQLGTIRIFSVSS